MKGYFSLSYDYYEDLIYFGSLKTEGLHLGTLRDLSNYGDRSALLLAHDVVEHSLKHRTKPYVTIEEEIRALGAVEFVRVGNSESLYLNPIKEIVYQLDYLSRDFKKVPTIWNNYLDSYITENSIEDLIDQINTGGITTNCPKTLAVDALRQYYWGYVQKLNHYKENSLDAYSDFCFIQRITPDLANRLLDADGTATGLSVYFDTHKQTYRTRYKRQ
jgi:hypothetical protein